MTQEDKELLLKNLCARLPYGVKVESVFINPDTKEHKPCGIEIFDATSLLMIRDGLGEFKPYLFPLSSMTEEQLKDLGTYYAKDSKIIFDNAIKSLESPLVMHKAAHVCFNTLEWYNKNHFDYMGLIEKGLAIDATGKNIY